MPKRGAIIASPVEVTDVAELPGGVALSTSEGRVLVAEHAVFCTGYEFLRQMQAPSHHVTSTWALTTKPIKDLPQWLHDTIVREAAEPYLYFRSDPTGRIIAGGEDEEAAEKNTSKSVLQQKTKRILEKLWATTGLTVGRPNTDGPRPSPSSRRISWQRRWPARRTQMQSCSGCVEDMPVQGDKNAGLGFQEKRGKVAIVPNLCRGGSPEKSLQFSASSPRDGFQLWPGRVWMRL